jgi:hypothetical protein
MRFNHIVLGIGLAVSLTAAVVAKPGPAAPAPALYKELVACKLLADPAQRLSCFDARIEQLEEATAVGEVVVTDRAAVRDTQKSLFGFRLPTFGLFGGQGNDQDQVQQIESTVSSARPFGYGSWRIGLADGSVWEQTDTERLTFDPEKGDKVSIYNAALGTFRMKVAGQRAIRVRRTE